MLKIDWRQLRLENFLVRTWSTCLAEITGDTNKESLMSSRIFRVVERVGFATNKNLCQLQIRNVGVHFRIYRIPRLMKRACACCESARASR